jgi:hypothetical protein
MTKIFLAGAVALSVLLPAAASAQSVYVGPGGVGVDVHDRYRSDSRRPREYNDGRYYRERGAGRGYCARLREACDYGERGYGNCRRYRQECG